MWLKPLSSPLVSGFKHFYWEKKVMLKTVDLLFAITFISFICPETQIQTVVIMHTWKYWLTIIIFKMDRWTTNYTL